MTRRAFSFIIKDPDGEVVDAVGLEARQPSLAAVPAERQDLLLRLLLRFGFVEAALAAVVNLNEATRGLERLQHAASAAMEADLVSLKFPTDRGERDGLPVHLCKGAVGDLDLDALGSRQRHCDTAVRKKAVSRILNRVQVTIETGFNEKFAHGLLQSTRSPSQAPGRCRNR